MDNYHIREITLDVKQDHCHSSKYNRSILSDLSKYDISEDIKLRANRIYTDMKPQTNRAKKRHFLLFFCVYNAYKELGITIAPEDIGKIFTLNKHQMQQAINIFSPSQTGYHPVKNQITILDYLKIWCDKLEFDKIDVDDIINMAENFINKNENLKHDVPQTAAAGLIKYYILTRGYTLDNVKLSEITNRSDTTIETMYKKICEMN
ncbi:MAG TPA: hypothetical protein VLG50_08390 [Candidatus Saccharimonadales bacterium]|nr:hypothetical protein [Candidatus Saccharimonadales bacterium]